MFFRSNHLLSIAPYGAVEDDLQKVVDETLGTDAMISFEDFRSMFGGASAAGRCC